MPKESEIRRREFLRTGADEARSASICEPRPHKYIAFGLGPPVRQGTWVTCQFQVTSDTSDRRGRRPRKLLALLK